MEKVLGKSEGNSGMGSIKGSTTDGVKNSAADSIKNSSRRFNSIGEYLKKHFDSKVIKLSLDGGFTCPNRDGTCGVGGCIFCSADGSGEFAGDIPGQLRLLSKKWPHGKYIVYFQNHTNTYAPADELREKFYAALKYGSNSDCATAPEISPEIVGIAIATRPDCLSAEVLDLLSELNENTFLWVELGLQTIHDVTARTINRGYDLKVFDEAMQKLKERDIRTVVHLIFGLPKIIAGGSCDVPNTACALAGGSESSAADSLVIPETKEEMLESVRYVCAKEPFGLKLHMLNVVRGSQMEKLCPNYVPFDSPEEYIKLVCDALEIIPPDITMHRLTADAPRPILIAPEWSYRKRTILNGIEKELRMRNSYQGCRYLSSHSGPRRPSL